MKNAAERQTDRQTDRQREREREREREIAAVHAKASLHAKAGSWSAAQCARELEL